LSGRDLPAPLRDLVPSWLPILSPVKVTTDDRPIFTAALYDLDARTAPILVEEFLDHEAFDPATFTNRGESAISDGALRVRSPRFSLDLKIRAIKPAVVFGDGTPELRHGRIVTSYVQRPRLALTGEITLDGERCTKLSGEGVHDHQWLRVGEPNLKWIWPHLRLADGRELTGYVIRESGDADADEGRELGRGGWIVETDGRVRAIAFDVRPLAHVATARGRVPTRFHVTGDGLDLEIDHVVPAPWLHMAAFGELIDGGIYEGPVAVRGHPAIRGWIEVMDAAHVRLRSSR
ncbi:MAG: lipocalin family protein, partial [Kofleriaceae bacterium]